MKELKELFPNINIENVKPRSNFERLTEQAKYFNESEGSLDELDCPICKNKGYIQNVVYQEIYQDYTTVISECKCMKKRKALNRAKKSGLGEYINKRFEDYKTTEEWQKNIKAKALKYVKQSDSEWFVSLGQSGSGKTLISCVIASYLLLVKNQEVIYITWTDFISKLKRDMMGDNTNAVSNYLDEIKTVEVLYIDELLKKYNEIGIFLFLYIRNLLLKMQI